MQSFITTSLIDYTQQHGIDLLGINRDKPLVEQALKEPERDRKKTKNIKHNGNISLDDVIEVAKVMRPRSMAKDLTGIVKEILGTCVSVGCTVDGKDPKDLQQEIADGDVEIP